jgi:hypothetical protein
MGNIDSRNVISAAFLRSSRTRNVRLFQKSDPNMVGALREQMARGFRAFDAYRAVQGRSGGYQRERIVQLFMWCAIIAGGTVLESIG